jgi:hypothetical protein
MFAKQRSFILKDAKILDKRKPGAYGFLFYCEELKTLFGRTRAHIKLENGKRRHIYPWHQRKSEVR